MRAIDISGMIAGCMSSITFLLQVIKRGKTKTAADVSLLMFTFATVSVILWLVDAIIVQDIAITFTNNVVFLFLFIMLHFKFRYGSRKAAGIMTVKALVVDEY